MSSHEQDSSKDDSGDWKYQLRLQIADEFAESVREGSHLKDLERLYEILTTHDATVVCQYDAFADFCVRCESNGEKDLPLYKWTLATIQDPTKKAKYIKVFTVYVRGDEVYDQSLADALENDLQPLVSNGVVEKLSKYDSNPANNPQVPQKYRS